MSTVESSGAVESGGVSAAPATIEPTAGIEADVPKAWVAAMRLSARICHTPFVPRSLRGDPASVLACILTGEELGLGPMQSLRMVNVIEGKPAASAELMRALVNRAGHRLSVVEAKQDRVTLHGQRRDTGAQATVTWTIADAQRAKLMGNPAWAKYPRSMLLARATSELCRQIFSDVIGGLYTPEEQASIEGRIVEPDEGELVDPVTRRSIDTATGEISFDDDTPGHVVQSTMFDAEDAMDAEWLAQARERAADDEAAARAGEVDDAEDT